MNFLRFALLALLLQNAAPGVIERVDPPYPLLARTARIEGNVQISVTVAPDGSVKEARVVSSSSPLLLPGAIDAVRQWRFAPSPNGGVTTIDLPFSLTAALPPGDVITGRVQTPEGEPIANVPVFALQFSYSIGRRSLRGVNSATTDDRGVYRIQSLAPGDYYVAAHYVQPANAVPGFRENYALDSYFPSTSDPASATFVNVRKGEESTADFRIQTMTHVRVSGKIIPPNGPTPRYVTSSVFLVSQSNGTDLQPIVQAVDSNNNPSGFPFEVRHVATGTYELFALLRDTSQYYFGRTTINVGGGDIAGISVPVHPGVPLNGQIVISSESEAFALSTLRLSYNPKEIHAPASGQGIAAAAVVNSDGTFFSVGLPEGRYGITSISGLPGDAFVSDIRMDGTGVKPDGIITVGADQAVEVQLTIARNGGTIEGKVLDAMQQPVGRAAVTLVPNAPKRENSIFYKRAISNSDGTFTIRGIAPGEYKLFAWENLPTTADENPDFISSDEQRGVGLSIKQGVSTPNVTLSVIPSKR